MREIKFRGITKNEEKFGNGKDGWIYGNLSIIDDKKYIQDINDKNYFKEVLPETVGQYAGLKDKNGKEIYEGDILRFYGNEIEDWIVSFEYAEFVGTFDNVSEKLYELADSMEVIGNIYDNPELLGGE